MKNEKENITKELIDDCINNCRIAQKKLYIVSFKMFIPICLRYSNSDYDARSLLNNGFLKICQNLKIYNHELSYYSWGKKIIVNTIIDEYRRGKKYNEIISIGIEHLSSGMNDQFNQDNNLVNESVADFSKETVKNILNSLPEMSRKVLSLYVFEGYNHKEIGELLKITENTSKWHLHNGKSKLKNLLLINPEFISTIG